MKKLALAAVAALTITGATPAWADVSEHCQQPGYCLFSGSDFDVHAPHDGAAAVRLGQVFGSQRRHSIYDPEHFPLPFV